MREFLIGIIVMTAYINVAWAQDFEKRANDLLKKMTTEEMVGQMTQVTLAVMTKDAWADTSGDISPQKLKEAISGYKVGSVLNATSNAFTLETWEKVVKAIQDEALTTRLKIPVLYGLDAIHGQTYTLGSTLFPHNLALAATRNPQYAADGAKVTAKELRASGVRWNFAPVLDIGRQPLWSRFPETYGEDVLIGKLFGSAAIKAYEEDGLSSPTAVASCMKHFLGYSNSRNGKDRTPIYMPEIETREYYLPQFREAVKAGASTIMINSTEINGTPMHADKYWLTDVLRNELGFEGVVVTDWEDIKRLHTWHHVAATPRQAVAMAINAGIDMSMVPGDFSFYDLLLEAIKLKEVPMTRIQDAVRRILILKMKLGLFGNPYTEPAAVANFGRPEYQEMALNAARESITLLKNNNGVLPLKKDMKILVAGPSAQSLSALNGCWSYTWQGNVDRWYPSDSKTILQAIMDKAGANNVMTTSVKGFTAPENLDAYSLQREATKADVIVLCIGEDAQAESPGNTRDLALDEGQVALVKAAQLTGKPVVLVLTEGRPRLISAIEPGSDGILMAYWAGKKSAEAIADVLFGDYNPNGRLPFSYPRSMGEMVLYDRKNSEEIREVFNNNIGTGYDPLFPFGHGLSYTQFNYSNLRLSSNTLTATGTLTITVTVTNNGKMAGKHAVELYSSDLYATITPSVKRLRAFTKIDLAPGQSRDVEFRLNKDDLAFVNAQLKTVTEPGDFEVSVGDLKAGFTYK